MKKLSFLFLLFTQVVLAGIPANTMPRIFDEDLSRYDRTLEQLDSLEQFVEHTGLTQSQLTASGHPLACMLLKNEAISGTLLSSNAPNDNWYMDVPGFLWGLCCSILGVIIVYTSVKDPAARRSEGTQSIYGCLVGSLLMAGIYIWMIFSVSG